MPKAKTEKIKLVHRVKSILFSVSVIGLSVIFLNVISDKSTACQQAYRQDVELHMNLSTVSAEVVRDPVSLQRGLGGRQCIGSNQAMLFDFEYAGSHGFWMKEMNFAIDILWLDEQKTIVHIEKNLLPSTYPKTFGTGVKSKYVIELESGYADKNGLEIGQTINW